MDFQQNDLFSYDELVQLLENELSAYNQSVLMYTKLSKYFIIQNDKLYVLQPNMTFKILQSTVENDMKFHIGKLLEQSVKLLTKDQIDILSFNFFINPSKLDNSSLGKDVSLFKFTNVDVKSPCILSSHIRY